MSRAVAKAGAATAPADAWNAYLEQHGLRSRTVTLHEAAPIAPDPVPPLPDDADDALRAAHAEAVLAHAAEQAAYATACQQPRQSLPDASGAPATVTLRSPDSVEGRRADVVWQDALVAFGKRAPGDTSAAAALIEAETGLLAAHVTAWTLPVPCDADHVRSLLERAPLARRAIDAAVSDRRSFYAAPSGH